MDSSSLVQSPAVPFSGELVNQVSFFFAAFALLRQKLFQGFWPLYLGCLFLVTIVCCEYMLLGVQDRRVGLGGSD